MPALVPRYRELFPFPQLGVGVAHVEERVRFSIGIAGSTPERQRLPVDFNCLTIVTRIRVDRRDVVERGSHPAPIVHLANQLKRLLVKLELTLAIPQLPINPGDIVQIDRDIPVIFQRTIDPQRRRYVSSAF